MHDLERIWVPPPQVTLHLSQSPHGVHPPSTGQIHYDKGHVSKMFSSQTITFKKIFVLKVVLKPKICFLDTERFRYSESVHSAKSGVITREPGWVDG